MKIFFAKLFQCRFVYVRIIINKIEREKRLIVHDIRRIQVAEKLICNTICQNSNSAMICRKISVQLCLLLFLTNTHTRRKYYVGNYAAVAVVAAGGAAFSVWAHREIEMYKAQFLQINCEELAANAAKKKSLYTEFTFWFDAHYVVFGLLLLGIALLIANVIWKRKLMKEERALIEQGKGAAA